MKTFDEYLDEKFPSPPYGRNFNAVSMLRKVWDYQQKEIDSLQKQVELLEKAIESCDCLYSVSLCSTGLSNDHSDNCPKCKTLKELKEMRGEG